MSKCNAVLEMEIFLKKVDLGAEGRILVTAPPP